MRRLCIVFVTVATALLLGCTVETSEEEAGGSSIPGDSGNETQQGDEPPEAVPQDLTDHEVLGVAASTEEQTAGMEVEVVRIDRVWDDAVAVTWQVRNVGDAEDASVNNLFGPLRVRAVAIEAGDRRAGPYEEEGDGNPFALSSSGVSIEGFLAPGEVEGFQAVFPDVGEDTVRFAARGFEPIEDLTIGDVPAAPEAFAGPPAAVLRAVSGRDVFLEVDALERHDELLVLRATVVNQSDDQFRGDSQRATMSYSWADGRGQFGTIEGFALLDPATNRKHLPLRDEENRCWCSAGFTTAAEDRRELVALFDAPPDADTTALALYVPEFGTLPQLPIVDADDRLALTINDHPVDDLQVAGERRPRLLAEIAEVEDDTVTRVTRSGGETTDVALAADVLFDVDEDELRSDATELIDDLVQQLEDVGAIDGTIVIEGHTDSTGPPDLNQDLSERRAASVLATVEDRLTRTDLTFATEGFGPDRPAVDEVDDETRQRNRRVEVRIPSP